MLIVMKVGYVWLVDWLVGWLVGWLGRRRELGGVGWRLGGGMIGWLVGWLVGFSGWSVGRFGWLLLLACWGVCVLAGWLVG